MTKQIFALFALGCSFAFATEEYKLEQDIDGKVEDISARKGVEISGTVRSASFNSYFESPQEIPSENGIFTNRMPSREIAEFVQLDLNFAFRPYDIITANLKLRLGAGMQEYFAPASTTVSIPWANIEGNLGNSFYWVIGDFRQAYSPLTLYMPGLDIMYEPVAFARKREMAQKDALIDGNQRNLQGFNLQFRPQFGETLGELRIEALGARLRRVGFLDPSGAMGNILPNEGIIGATQAGRFDKFLLGGNLEFLPLNKNLLIGATYLSIFDDKSSSVLFACDAGCRQTVSDMLNTLDSLPQKTFVYAGRAGVDVAGLIGLGNLVANLTGEFAMSDDKVYEQIPNLENEVEIIDISKQETGKAILAQMDLGYKSDFSVTLSSSFISNDTSWFNNVAQSPSFFARRILNSDKDVGCLNKTTSSSDCNMATATSVNDRSLNLSKYGVYSPLYSSFDALYFFTPKHSPMVADLSPGEPGGPAQTQSYNIAPYVKNSWGPSTLTRAELALLEKLSDLNLQMALPNGFATSNRQGFQEVLTADWKGLAEVKGLFANYEQLSSLDTLAKAAKYTEFGGGAKVNVLGLLGFEQNPLELSGSYKHSAKEQEWKEQEEEWSKAEYKSDFINAGLYYRFFRRFGVTFGYQQINSNLNFTGAEVQKMQTADLNVKIVPVVKSTQNQWMAGIDYTIAKNAWLSINYGIMTVENTYDIDGFTGKVKDEDGNETDINDGIFIRDANNYTNLPGYVVVNGAEEGATKLKHKFSRNILEATINVEF
jgi:hypothetical protein